MITVMNKKDGTVRIRYDDDTLDYGFALSLTPEVAAERLSRFVLSNDPLQLSIEPAKDVRKRDVASG